MKSIEMKEKIIEQKFVQAVRDRGGQALKFVSPGLDGVPDRLVLLPGGRCFFAELKAPGEKPRKLQRHRIAMIRELGFHVLVIDDPAQISRALSLAAGELPDPDDVVTLRKPYRMPAPVDDALWLKNPNEDVGAEGGLGASVAPPSVTD